MDLPTPVPFFRPLAGSTALLVAMHVACGGSPAPVQGEADGDTLAAATVPPAGSYDWLIHGGMVVDGTGAPGRILDLLLKDGEIAWMGVVGQETVDVAHVLDATGLVVAPGFIDAHAHGDPVGSPAFRNFLAMGVTTIVLGQDGSSPPARGLAQHLEAADRAGPSVNVAYLAGHNTLRLESGVGFGTPDPAGLQALAGLVATAMDAGAFGLSTGLEYDPGVRAGMDELVAAARPVAERGGVVMSHMRNEDADAVEASLAELLEQGRRSGARVHASHLKVVLGHDPAQAQRMLSAMTDARAQGYLVTGDVYPYTASFTGLAILFPDWTRPPHDYAAVARARRAELLEHLRTRVEGRNGPEATLFGSGPYAGQTLADVARARNRPFEEILVELGPGGARAAYFVMDEGVMSTFLADPFVAVASDGSPGMAHPRGYGTFPLILQRWVQEERLLTLEEAVRKMTSLPASIVGLDIPGTRPGPPSGARRARGRISEGWAADLAIFRLDAVEATADFQEPHRLARGIRHVFVNGEPVWTDGEPVMGPGRGKALRFAPNGMPPSTN
ncbi:MAG: amidohydrolase family protein [Gemmatimonadota bacterium]